MSEFGTLLRKLRKGRGLTQKQVAEKLNNQGYDSYGKATISKWEGGRTTPREALVEVLEDILLPASDGSLLKAAGYPEAANQAAIKQGLGDSRKALTVEDIVAEEERRKAILGHQNDLRAAASRWKSELWLPTPWRWDIANLRYVFYLDSKNHRTGYKLPGELVSGEESRGHFRYFGEGSGSVTWDVLEGGSITLRAPVEDEAGLGNLKDHSQGAPVWGLFTEWKDKGGTYIQLCSSLLARIEQDAKEAIGAKSELSWWSIYHDAFCTEDTLLRCGRCGTENPYAFTCPICGDKFSQKEEIKRHIGDNHPKADPKAWLLPHCQNCFMPLGWLRPFLKGYKRASDDPRSSAVSIDGWTNIEESIEIERFGSYIRGHAVLRDKYRGCDLVDTILEAEKELRQVQVRLIGEVTSLSEQEVFLGKCPACSDY